MQHNEKYVLTLSHKQAVLVKVVLEEYFRIRLNQWTDVAESLVMRGVTKEVREKDFDTLLAQRNMANEVFSAVGRALNDPYTFTPKQEDELMATEIWEVIRHALWMQREDKDAVGWCVDSQEPMQWSDEPLPKIEILKEE
jgi:hypothetical protein